MDVIRLWPIFLSVVYMSFEAIIVFPNESCVASEELTYNELCVRLISPANLIVERMVFLPKHT